MRQVLRLRLALLRRSLGVARVCRIAVGRVHRTLLVRRRLVVGLRALRLVAGLGALIVGR